MHDGGDRHDELTGVGVSCLSCGESLSPTAKFCSECGNPVGHAQAAEYKQVTVLFADVVHSMDIAAAVGPERLREIMADLVSRAALVVRRLGGAVNKFTGDGIMAVFGAPVALEDHAVRGCLAALGVQDEASQLAAEVLVRDHVVLRLRVGLNSGEVIAGEIGSGSFGYTTIGEQVGMAQRMESVAPPGGVMLTASTARLVEDIAHLAEPELIRIKGAAEPVQVRRLLGMSDTHRGRMRVESSLVGRQWELSATEALLNRAVAGHGGVVRLAGPPGIGKSRMVREVTALAGRSGMDVFTAFCESHTSQVPFQAVARLLRAATGVDHRVGEEARAWLRGRLPHADPEDLVLLDELLGIADTAVPLPKIDPDARRRRLTALVISAVLARGAPAVYVIEDVHWIDEISESMIADFLTVIPQTPSLILITHRPDYLGALTRVAGSQTIALAPLNDREISELMADVVGLDPSAEELVAAIVDRAAGNPFFAEEIVRDLIERNMLRGEPRAYVSTSDASEINVPATLQATIAARIDRLDSRAKRTLGAAAVIGSQFETHLLTSLGIEPRISDLVNAQLVEQVTFNSNPTYAFNHPLIRAVAYESQLRSDRAELHRRLATAIQHDNADSVDENAALIAGHLDAAGDASAAHHWHMRAGTWANSRDISASWVSWERARQIADALPADDPDVSAMRIAARTMLCGNGWRAHWDISERFDELRELCTQTGDMASLAIGMAGLIPQHYMRGRVREASRVGSEVMALVESIGEPNLTIGFASSVPPSKFGTGEIDEALRWSQTVIDLADGDPTKGNFMIGSPLAVAFAMRGTGRVALGQLGWRADYELAIDMARGSDMWTRALVGMFAYASATETGAIAGDQSLADVEEVARMTERSGADLVRGTSLFTLAVMLLHQSSEEDRKRGLAVLGQVRDLVLSERFYLTELWTADMYFAREMADEGDQDGALPLMREALDKMFLAGILGHVDPSAAMFIATLLRRGGTEDVAEAEATIAKLEAAPGVGTALREVWLLRVRALVAAANGDDATYRDLRDRYRTMATSLDLAGHVKWAQEMA